MTALGLACDSGHLDIVQTLASSSLVDVNGSENCVPERTPLVIAMEVFILLIYEYLITNKCINNVFQWKLFLLFVEALNKLELAISSIVTVREFDSVL